MKKNAIYMVLSVLLFILTIYTYLFYPQQSMPIGESVCVTTIDTAKYHNDCLHPCIRYDAKSNKYYMSQSPYYAWNNKVENPMFYTSDTYREWHNGTLIYDTPKSGFNSDPNICLLENGEIYYIWREFMTPLCDSLGCVEMAVGGLIDRKGNLLDKNILCINTMINGDTEQAPVMIEHKGKCYIYATWYQYEPERKNRGIAIWERGEKSDDLFRLIDTIPFESCYTVDRIKNIPLFSHFLYVPKPIFHDLWHFDLFEYGARLWMVSVAEKGDNIMLSVSEDWKRFKTFRKPLVNNHYTENYCGYRQYYYKPTAFVKDDTLHVFYTANAKNNPSRNQLFHTSSPAKNLLK